MRTQLARDPLRQHGRHLGADADELDVRNRPQLAENPFELVVAERERVAAGDQHVANLRRAPQIIERGQQPALLRHQLAVPDHARPRAITAIRRAEVERQEQHAIRITMHQARHRAVRIFAQRIVRLALGAHELIERRHDRSPQRLQRILRRPAGSCSTARCRRAASSRLAQALRAPPPTAAAFFPAARACGFDAAFATASRSNPEWSRPENAGDEKRASWRSSCAAKTTGYCRPNRSSARHPPAQDGRDRQ